MKKRNDYNVYIFSLNERSHFIYSLFRGRLRRILDEVSVNCFIMQIVLEYCVVEWKGPRPYTCVGIPFVGFIVGTLYRHSLAIAANSSSIACGIVADKASSSTDCPTLDFLCFSVLFSSMFFRRARRYKCISSSRIGEMEIFSDREITQTITSRSALLCVSVTSPFSHLSGCGLEFLTLNRT